jgi:hypothetical protein
MEGATDSFIGQYGALSWRADMPEDACPQSHWTISCVCRSWVWCSRTQINAGNTIQPCRRNDEQGKWEPIATCRNVHQAKHVKLHGSGPNTEKGIVWSPQVKMPLEKYTPRWRDNIKMDLISVWTGFMWLRIGTSGGLLWTQQWTSELYKTMDISRVAEQLLDPQDGQMPLGKPRSRWKDSIKLDFREVVQNRAPWRALVSTTVNFWVVWNGGHFDSSWATTGSSGGADATRKT